MERIHTLQQMVSIQWGMHTEKCLCLTGIPWRLSLRWGMLFLSWDSGVLAWLPERWSSARQRTDFSALGIWLSWLPTPTDPKQGMRNKVHPVCVSLHVCLSVRFLTRETSCRLERIVSENRHRDKSFLCCHQQRWQGETGATKFELLFSAGSRVMIFLWPFLPVGHILHTHLLTMFP